MKLNFCTLFNSAYLSRGLALYNSLKAHCHDFQLYVFAFDDPCYKYLNEIDLPGLKAISLQEFEDNKLLQVKPGRTAAEYCWTCTPSTVLYCIEKFGLDNCTYLDADMIFYSNPSVLIEEMGERSVLITEHRYTARYDQSATSGIYCVQFVSFKNNDEGMKVLRWWRDACLDWCYNRFEDGKFGDQKYLDNWTKQFKGVHVMRHEGGGVAPWNVQQYNIRRASSGIELLNKKTGKRFPLIFFHFHSLKFFLDNVILFCDTGYDLSGPVQKLIYAPYVKELKRCSDLIQSKDKDLNENGAYTNSPFPPGWFKSIRMYYRRNLQAGIRNVFGTKILSQLRNHYYHYLTEF